jgi:cobalt-zinc-cadmium efflux system protein
MAAGVNAGWLLVLSVLVAAGAADRLVTGTHPVHGLPVLIISGTAAAVMFAGALILARDLDGDLITRAVSLDTAADAADAAGVAATGGVILATGRLFWLDPFVALIIALVIGYQAVRLLREITAALGRQHALPR